VEGVSVKLLTLDWYIRPEAALSTDRAGALDLESNLVIRIGACWKVDVVSCNVRRSIVAKREKIDVLSTLLQRSHCAGPDEERNKCEVE